MFTAVLPPEEVVADLDRYLEPRRDAGADRWRWSRPEGWHVTTSFMDSVTEHASVELVDHLAEVARQHEPFHLRLQGARCFPSAAAAKVLTLDAAEGGAALGALARACRSAASRAGAAPDGATFVGHLTLGRTNRGFDATAWVHVVDSFPGWAWQVSELVLVASHLADRGNRYEVLERFTLGSPGI